VTPGASGDLAERLHARMLAESATASFGFEHVAELARQEAPLLAPGKIQRLVAEVLARAKGLGPLEPLRADREVSEVMVNGPNRVWVERAGSLCRVEVDVDAPTIEHVIEKIVGPLGLRVDRASPMVDARLPDGSRINAVVPTLGRGRAMPHHPALCPPGHPSREVLPGTGGLAAALGGASPDERLGVRPHLVGEDHPAQRPRW
jgi:hypothetical protein